MKFIGKLQVTQPNTQKLSRKGYLNEQNANLAGSIARAIYNLLDVAAQANFV